MIACDSCGEEILPGFQVLHTCAPCGLNLCPRCFDRDHAAHHAAYVERMWPA